MRLPDILADYDYITIRTERGSGEIYTGRAAEVNFDEINTWCIDRLNSAFLSAQLGVKYSRQALNESTPGLREKARQKLAVKQTAVKNALERLKAFVPVEERDIVDIYNSILDPAYYFITVTGTDGGLEYCPQVPPLQMNTDGAVNLLAGLYTNIGVELQAYIRRPPVELWRMEELEAWVLQNPLNTPVEGKAFLRTIYMRAAMDRLRPHLLAGTAVPKKWRKDRRMNLVILKGRTTADIELKEYGNDGVRTNFTLAVDRRSRDDGADFIYCVMFGKRAEALAKYVTKGTLILISGRLNSRTYETEEGRRQNTISVIAEDWEFCESKAASQARQGAGSEAPRREQDTRREQDRQPVRREQDRRRRDYDEDYYRNPDFR